MRLRKMSSQILSRIWLTKSVLAFGLSTACIFAQSDRSPLVELYTDNSGLYFPAGRTLYATIFMDGHIDVMDTANRDIVIRHETLSRNEIDKLKKMIAKKAFRELHGTTQAERHERFQDYHTSLEVIVHYPQGIQSFTMRDFDAEDGRPFPPSFNNFLCLIDDLKKVEYRLSSNCK